MSLADTVTYKGVVIRLRSNSFGFQWSFIMDSYSAMSHAGNRKQAIVDAKSAIDSKLGK